jgi:hypothetical protein
VPREGTRLFTSPRRASLPPTRLTTAARPPPPFFQSVLPVPLPLPQTAAPPATSPS